MLRQQYHGTKRRTKIRQKHECRMVLLKKKIKNQTLTKTVQHFTPPCLTFGVFTVCIIVQHVCTISQYSIVCLTY